VGGGEEVDLVAVFLNFFGGKALMLEAHIVEGGRLERSASGTQIWMTLTEKLYLKNLTLSGKESEKIEIGG